MDDFFQNTAGERFIYRQGRLLASKYANNPTIMGGNCGMKSIL